MSTETERCVDELMIKVINIEHQLEVCKQDLQNAILANQARSRIADLQSFIDNNKPSIPPYCLKKAIEASNKLELLIDEPLKRAKVQFKFNFSSKLSKKASDEKPMVADKPSEPPQTTELPKSVPSNVSVFGFVDRINESLSLGIEEVRMKDVSLINLRGCNVVIHGLVGTIYISDLVDSSVTVCLAQRAVTLRNCSNCSFKLVCQQLRIDSTKDSSFETFVSCRSMLESSTGLKFQRVDLDSLDIPEQQVSQLFSEAGFQRSNNNWRMIDDFDSLARGGECSHNFTRIAD